MPTTSIIANDHVVLLAFEASLATRREGAKRTISMKDSESGRGGAAWKVGTGPAKKKETREAKMVAGRCTIATCRLEPVLYPPAVAVQQAESRVQRGSELLPRVLLGATIAAAQHVDLDILPALTMWSLLSLSVCASPSELSLPAASST